MGRGLSCAYFCTESGVRCNGCGGECDEDLCASDDRRNGFLKTEQSVRCNDRVVHGEGVERIRAIVTCLHEKIGQVSERTIKNKGSERLEKWNHLPTKSYTLPYSAS